jgi:hypothetical protein
MCKKAKLIFFVISALLFQIAAGFCQSQSEYALIRRKVFGNPEIWRLTKSITNDYWDIDLFGYPRASAQSYIMDPYGQLYSGVSFKLDRDWCRIVYAEAYGNWIRAYSSYGSSGCQLWAPKSIASLAPFNDEWASYYHYVYVADTENDRIVRLQYDWDNQLWLCNTPITGSGLERPGDLDLNDGGTFWPNTDDYLWVINSTAQGANTIMMFTVDGVLRLTFGNHGCDGQMGDFCRLTAIVSVRSAFLTEPYDMYANTDHFFVADAGNNRIVMLYKEPGSETVYWIAEISTSSSIVDLETDIFGHLWAVDQDAGMITKYRFDLYPLCTFGSSGIGENQFLQPISMTNNGGYYGFGNMSVAEAWTDSSGGQYFAIGTDILDFSVSASQDQHWHYISYTLIDPSKVSIKIYNNQSQLVRTLFEATQFSGPCFFVWDGSDDSGQQVPSGNYRVVVTDSSGYENVETGEPVNVVVKEAWFYHDSTASSCCTGIRGNVNGDAGDAVNVADLTYLINYLQRGGPPPPCPEEANTNGDAGENVNIADVTYLVDFLFRGGPPPPPCP